MKVRSGFVSNSSSSSFILSGIDVEEVINFCKECYTNKINKDIEEIKNNIQKYKETGWANRAIVDVWNADIRRFNYYLTKVDKIRIDKVKDIEWDLSEWFDNLNPEDLVLYDEDDNILNYIGEEIVEKFNVEKYCLHM